MSLTLWELEAPNLTTQVSFLLFATSTSSHLAENAGHHISLLLGSLVSSQLSLSHFQCSLVLSNFKKLSDSLLIWGKASNFPDQIPYKENSFATFSFAI